MATVKDFKDNAIALVTFGATLFSGLNIAAAVQKMGTNEENHNNGVAALACGVVAVAGGLVGGKALREKGSRLLSDLESEEDPTWEQIDDDVRAQKNVDFVNQWKPPGAKR